MLRAIQQRLSAAHNRFSSRAAPSGVLLSFLAAFVICPSAASAAPQISGYATQGKSTLELRGSGFCGRTCPKVLATVNGSPIPAAVTAKGISARVPDLGSGFGLVAFKLLGQENFGANVVVAKNASGNLCVIGGLGKSSPLASESLVCAEPSTGYWMPPAYVAIDLNAAIFWKGMAPHDGLFMKAINSAGQAVGVAETGGQDGVAVNFTMATGFRSFASPSAAPSTGVDINAKGVAIVAAYDTAAAAWQTLLGASSTALKRMPTNRPEAFPISLNDQGNLLFAWIDTANGYVGRSSLLSRGYLQDVPVPPGVESIEPLRLANDGSAALRGYSATGSSGWVYTKQRRLRALVELQPELRSYKEVAPADMNDGGAVVGTAVLNRGEIAFLSYQDGRPLVDIDSKFSLGGASEASALNNLAEVIGVRSDGVSPASQRTWVYHGEEFRHLQESVAAGVLGDCDLVSPTDISNEGLILALANCGPARNEFTSFLLVPSWRKHSLVAN